jgi:hypothetical protein
MFTGPLMLSAYNSASDIAPFSPTYSFQGNPGPGGQLKFDNPWASLAGGNPFASGNFSSLSYVPAKNSTFILPTTVSVAFAPNFKLGVTQNWSFSIEQQLTPSLALHLSYVGNESYHQGTVIDANAGGAGAGQPADVRPNSNFSGIEVDRSLGTSSYNSLNASIDKHLSHGLSLQSSFAWAKSLSMSDTDNVSMTGAIGNPFDLRWNRGISQNNMPLSWSSNLIYRSPDLKRMHLNHAVKGVLSSWEFTTIYMMHSGSPINISGGSLPGTKHGDDSGSLQGGDRADMVPGQTAWTHHGSRSQWLNEYFNIAAFTNNAAGTFGTSGRNMLTGPSVSFADSALSKNVMLYEGYNLQFRFELFNTLNHASFGPPDGSVGDQSFGQINQIGTEPARVGQISAKLTF